MILSGGGKSLTAVPAEAADRVPFAELLALGVFWYAMSFQWGALLTVVLPAEVLRFAPESQKGLYLGGLFAGGAAMAMIVSPVAGALSDRSTLPLGRRRPFVIAGVLVDCAALVAMRYAPSYGALVAAFLAAQLAMNFSGGAFNGLIPDRIPSAQRGAASGVMGFMLMMGTITAALVAGRQVGRGATSSVYWIIAAVVLISTALMVFGIAEVPFRVRLPWGWRTFLRSFWIDPRRYPDFAWVFATRGLVMLGFYTLISFLQFFIKDTLQLSREQAAQATGTLSAVTIASGTVVALVAGWASDRIGRKGIVSAAGLFLALTSVGLLLRPPYAALVGIAALFGIGYGAYTSVDWALAVDVLPSSASAAKDLGIWAIANTLPQVLAPALAGPILDAFNRQTPALGYTVVFSAAIVYVVLGSLFVWQIRGVR